MQHLSRLRNLGVKRLHFSIILIKVLRQILTLAQTSTNENDSDLQERQSHSAIAKLKKKLYF